MLLDLHWRPPERAAPHVRHSPPVAGENGSLVDSWEDGGYLPGKECSCKWTKKFRFSEPWQGCLIRKAGLGVVERESGAGSY